MLTLIKPVTWFPPIWAFLCGAVSGGVGLNAGLWPVLAGAVLAGPIVCGMSQAANDWCDRHVDAINEPHRPIPSGRIPGRWGLWIALAMTALGLAIGLALGPWVGGATILATLAAWAYSAEPVRLKKSGVWGPGLVGLSYETLPWITGAALAAGGAPGAKTITIAILYGIGAHGIMTLNDFKALEGDRKLGIASLPAAIGPKKAAAWACWMMMVPQVIVVALLFFWGAGIAATIIAGLMTAQAWAMSLLLSDPKKYAPWYNGTGVLFYVSGMMVAAVALRGLI